MHIMKVYLYKILIRAFNSTGLYDFLRWGLYLIQDKYGWLRAINRIRIRDQAALQPRQVPPVQKKIFIYHTFVTMSFMSLEHFLHLAFQIKGYHPVSMYHDGFLPIAYNGESLKKKGFSLRRFTKMVRNYYEAFGIVPRGMSEYLNRADCYRHAHTIASEIPDHKLTPYIYRNIQVGEMCLRNLHHQIKGLFRLDSSERVELFRLYIQNAIMAVDLAYAALEIEKPDTVILFSGRLIDSVFMYEVCKKEGVHTVTWEMGFDWSSVVFAHNSYANHYIIPQSYWTSVKDVPLTQTEEQAVDDYYGAWKAGKAARAYYKNEEKDFSSIAEALGLDPALKTISLFPNLLWESSSQGVDVGFDGILDWIFFTIRFVVNHPEFQLIIRAHPAENLDHPDWQTAITIPQLIREEFGQPDPRVKIIERDSQFSSYEIARNSDYISLYTSTLGPEFTLMGLKPMICGDCYYRDRGFTNDVLNKSDYESILLGKRSLIEPDIKLAKIFLHHFLFKLFKKIEILKGRHMFLIYKYHYEIDSFQGFPEKFDIFNGIVDAIIQQTDFVG